MNCKWCEGEAVMITNDPGSHLEELIETKENLSG
jgi:hypothetical protein